MNLLEKFEQVNVRAEDRISESDRMFCEANQEAYERARQVLLQTAETLAEAEAEQERLLRRGERDEVYVTYLGTKYENGAEKFYSLLDGTHKRFVIRVTEYFANKYHVSLDSDDILKPMLREKPVEPSTLRAMFYVSPARWTTEEREKYNEKKAEYEQAVAEAEAYNRNLSIRYEDILDAIFAQLGGGSFQDVALRELRDACHDACWNRYSGKPAFEQKKSVIRFTGYACSIDHIHEKYKSDGEESEFRLSDGMKDVVAALSYFETGTQNGMDYRLSSLCNYSVIGPDHPIHSRKIVNVRLYKTGRVDVRFQSEAYARAFVEQFIGEVA